MSLTVALRGGLVSQEQRIDSFREFRARAFVNATRVDPEVVVSVGFCDSSTFASLEVSQLLCVGSVAHLLENDLLMFRIPNMGENGVWWDVLIIGFLESEVVATQEAHFEDVSALFAGGHYAEESLSEVRLKQRKMLEYRMAVKTNS